MSFRDRFNDLINERIPLANQGMNFNDMKEAGLAAVLNNIDGRKV